MNAPEPEAPVQAPGLLVAISATFTATPLYDVLSCWLGEMGLAASVAFAPYHQVFQQLLDPISLLGSNREGLNVVLVRPEDLVRHQPDGVDVAAALGGSGEELASALRAAAGRAAVPHVVMLCPPSPGAAERPDLAAGLRRFEEALAAGVAGLPSLHLIRPDEVLARYPVASPHSPGGDAVGHLPYTEEWFAAAGTALARTLHALRAPAPKAIAVDCDHTLWTGTVGEDGPLGVVVDEPRLALQRVLLEQLQAGALLCLCSKNEERDVDEVLDRHPGMLLRRHHFVARRINWRPKSENLHALARELKLAPDAFVLLDDSPLECAEVAAGCPGVRALALPAAPAEVPRFLQHLWVLDRLQVTEEDRRRTDLYQQEAERERLRQASPSLGEFLAGLQLEVEIAPARPEQLARVAQLSERTTQLNVNGARWTEAQLRLLEGGARCLAVSVKDRFGDYGLVGALLAAAEGEALRVQLLALSCRALGRGVEHRMLAALGRMALEQGLLRVEVPFLPTARNTPAAELLREVGAGYAAADGPGTTYRFPAEVAARIAYAPDAAAARARREEADPPSPAAAPPARPAWRLSAVQLLDAALELSRPQGVLARIRSRRKPRPAELPPYAPPRSALEGFLAAAWADLFGVDQVSIHDDFFDLGGDSLLATMIIARLRDELQISLPLEAVASAPTVAALADAVTASNPDRRLEIEQLASALTPAAFLAQGR